MSNTVKKPRPHAELRKKWLEDDRMVIEFFSQRNGWLVIDDPRWDEDTLYREKPKSLVTKYKIAFELKSGEQRISMDYYSTPDAFKRDQGHLNFNWVEPILASKKAFEEY